MSRRPWRTAFTLAESVLRTGYRIHTPRLCGSCDRAQRGPSSSHPDRVFPVLSSFPASSVLGAQLAHTPLHRAAVRGRRGCSPTSRRFTSPVQAACRVTVDPIFQFDLSSTQADRADVPQTVFPTDSRLLRGYVFGRDPIRLVSSRLVQSPDGVFGKDSCNCCPMATSWKPTGTGMARRNTRRAGS